MRPFPIYLPLIFFHLAAAAVAEDPAVSFRREIAPVLHRRCAACHNQENAKGKYRLDTFAALRTAGDTELPSLTPGDLLASEVYERLIATDSTDRMPQKADPLPERD